MSSESQTQLLDEERYAAGGPALLKSLIDEYIVPGSELPVFTFDEVMIEEAAEMVLLKRVMGIAFWRDAPGIDNLEGRELKNAIKNALFVALLNRLVRRELSQPGREAIDVLGSRVKIERQINAGFKVDDATKKDLIEFAVAHFESSVVAPAPASVAAELSPRIAQAAAVTPAHRVDPFGDGSITVRAPLAGDDDELSFGDPDTPVTFAFDDDEQTDPFHRNRVTNPVAHVPNADGIYPDGSFDFDASEPEPAPEPKPEPKPKPKPEQPALAKPVSPRAPAQVKSDEPVDLGQLTVPMAKWPKRLGQGLALVGALRVLSGDVLDARNLNGVEHPIDDLFGTGHASAPASAPAIPTQAPVSRAAEKAREKAELPKTFTLDVPREMLAFGDPYRGGVMRTGIIVDWSEEYPQGLEQLKRALNLTGSTLDTQNALTRDNHILVYAALNDQRLNATTYKAYRSDEAVSTKNANPAVHFSEISRGDYFDTEAYRWMPIDIQVTPDGTGIVNPKNHNDGSTPYCDLTKGTLLTPDSAHPVKGELMAFAFDSEEGLTPEMYKLFVKGGKRLIVSVRGMEVVRSNTTTPQTVHGFIFVDNPKGEAHSAPTREADGTFTINEPEWPEETKEFPQEFKLVVTPKMVKLFHSAMPSWNDFKADLVRAIGVPKQRYTKIVPGSGAVGGILDVSEVNQVLTSDDRVLLTIRLPGKGYKKEDYVYYLSNEKIVLDSGREEKMSLKRISSGHAHSIHTK